MTHTRLAVVMPAYNESQLGGFLLEIDRNLADHVQSLVFVVVDDASDPPLEVPPHVARDLAGSVELIVNEVNLGHGPSALRAYRRGLEHSPDILIHVDGDGQFKGEDFRPMLRAAEQGCVAHGVRISRTDPWYRRAISSGLRRSLAPRGTKDVNTPLRAYPAHLAAELLACVPIDALVPHVHFTLWENWIGMPCRQVPVTHLARRGTTPTGTSWQGRRPGAAMVPPRKLLKFCYAAAKEVARLRVRHQFRPSAGHQGVLEAVVLVDRQPT